MSEIEEQTFQTPDGLTLVGDVGGPEGAPTVILLHGGGQTRRSWSGAMHSLVERGYRVINYDARGHGMSSWSPEGDYSIKTLSEDIKAIIQTLSGKVALVGASMGGITSFYALGSGEFPVACALVMVDVTLRPPKSAMNRIQGFMTANPDGFATLDEVADAVAAFNPDRPRSKNPEGLLKNLRKGEDGRYRWHWDPLMTKGDPNYSPILLSVAHKVTVPTLLLRGGNSDVVTDEAISEMQQLVPQTEVMVVPGMGHTVPGVKNDAFNESLINFLKCHLPVN